VQGIEGVCESFAMLVAHCDRGEMSGQQGRQCWAELGEGVHRCQTGADTENDHIDGVWQLAAGCRNR